MYSQYPQDTEDVDAYKDYTFIMYVMCDKTASFYSKIKNVINIPIVICSSGLSILNTTVFDEDTGRQMFISYLGIVLNLLIALSVAILNVFKITEKEFSFKSHSMNFLKLHNKINAEVARCKTISADVDIITVIAEYNLICEYITFHIPSRIRRDIQKNYPNHKLPVLLTNSKKDKKSGFQQIFYIKAKKEDDISSNSSYADTITSTIANAIIYPRASNDQQLQFSPLQQLSSSFSIITENRKGSPVYALPNQELSVFKIHASNVSNVSNVSPRRHSRSSSPVRTGSHCTKMRNINAAYSSTM